MKTEGALRFFFYGTLIGGGPLLIRRALGKLNDLGPRHVPGVLYAIPDPDGWYPALLTGEGTVMGRLYQAGADFGAAELAVLDAYEDFDPADRDGSLYLREFFADGAQVYRFNQPLPEGARAIPGRRFRRLDRTRRRCAVRRRGQGLGRGIEVDRGDLEDFLSIIPQ